MKKNGIRDVQYRTVEFCCCWRMKHKSRKEWWWCSLLCSAIPDEVESERRDARYCVTISGLEEGKHYKMRVAAVNEVGQGPYSQTNITCMPKPKPVNASTFFHLLLSNVKIIIYSYVICQLLFAQGCK